MPARKIPPRAAIAGGMQRKHASHGRDAARCSRRQGNGEGEGGKGGATPVLTWVMLLKSTETLLRPASSVQERVARLQ